MKKCLNCKSDIRETDIYCRNCGIKIESDKHYIFINILTVIVVIGLLCLIALYVASFLMNK